MPPILLPFVSLALPVFVWEVDWSVALLPVVLLLFVFSFNVVNEECGDAGEQMRCVFVLLVLSSLEEECFKERIRIEQTLTLYSVFGVRSFSLNEHASPR